MNYFDNSHKIAAKLGELLDDHSLLYQINAKSYPITLTITQDQDVGAQMELYSNAEGGVSSSDAVLQYIFKLNGMETRTAGRLVISDDLMSKIKGLVKKWHAAYLAAFFAHTRKAQAEGIVPDGEPDADDEGDFDEFYDEEEPVEDEE